MKCAWCEGPADAEYVDIGVGLQQVTAACCRDCGAVQMGGYGEDKADATSEENRRGWWMGPDTEDFMIHVLETDHWYNAREWVDHMLGVPDNDPRAYRLHERLFVADLMGVVHEAYTTVYTSMYDYDRRFQTCCGYILTVAGSGPRRVATCVTCATQL